MTNKIFQREPQMENVKSSISIHDAGDAPTAQTGRHRVEKEETLFNLLGPLAYTTPAFRKYLLSKMAALEKQSLDWDKIVSIIRGDIREVGDILRENYSKDFPQVTCETVNRAFEDEEFRKKFGKGKGWKRHLITNHPPPAFNRASYFRGISMFILPSILVWIIGIGLYFLDLPLLVKTGLLALAGFSFHLGLTRGEGTWRMLGLWALLSVSLSLFVTNVGYWGLHASGILLGRTPVLLPVVFFVAAFFGAILLGYFLRSWMVLFTIPSLVIPVYFDVTSSILSTFAAVATFALVTLFVVTFEWAATDIFLAVLGAVRGGKYFQVRTKNDVLAYWPIAQRELWKKFVAREVAEDIQNSPELVEHIIDKAVLAGIVPRCHADLLKPYLRKNPTKTPFYLLWSALLGSMIERGEIVPLKKGPKTGELLFLGEENRKERLRLASRVIADEGFERIKRFMNNSLHDGGFSSSSLPPVTVLITAYDEKVVADWNELKEGGTLDYFRRVTPHLTSCKGKHEIVEKLSNHLPLLKRTMRESRYLRDAYLLRLIFNKPSADVRELQKMAHELVQVIMVYENYLGVNKTQQEALLELAEKYDVELVWNWKLHEVQNGRLKVIAENPHGFKFVGRKAYGQSMAMSFAAHQPILFMDANCSSLPEAVFNLPSAVDFFNAKKLNLMCFSKYIYSDQTVFGRAWKVAEETLCNLSYFAYDEFRGVSFLGHSALIRRDALANGGLAYDTVTEDVMGELNVRLSKKGAVGYYPGVQIGKGRELYLATSERPHVRWAEGGTRYYSSFAWKRFLRSPDIPADEKFFTGYKFLYPFKPVIGRNMVFIYLFFILFAGLGVMIGSFPIPIWGFLGLVLSQSSVIPASVYMCLTHGSRGALKFVSEYPVLSSVLSVQTFGYTAHGFKRGISSTEFSRFRIAPKTLPSLKRIPPRYPKRPMVYVAFLAIFLAYAFVRGDPSLILLAACMFFAGYFISNFIHQKDPLGPLVSFGCWGAGCIALSPFTAPYPNILLPGAALMMGYLMFPIVAMSRPWYFRHQRVVSVITPVLLAAALGALVLAVSVNFYVFALMFSLFYILTPVFVLLGLALY